MAAKPLRDFVPYARSTSEPVDFNYLEIVSYNVGNVGMDFRTPGASCPLFKLCWSWAVEGLRDWFESVSPDIILLQETMGQSQVFGEDWFGRLVSDPSQIVLADEISPDGCRLWDLKTGEKMDKDRFRRDLGNVMEAYEEVLKRLKARIESN